jgi:arylsulfatase A-like enzyme
VNHSRHTRRDFLKALSLGVTSVAISGCKTFKSRASSSRMDRSKPNFIIIFTDDQGYNDVGCFGSQTIETPRLDRMADEGMKLTSFYSQTVCGPARCALLTGCYPKRAGFDASGIKGWRISTKEITTVEVLKQAGYTSACIGKWDLSARTFTEGLVPNDQGFDYYFGTLGANDRGRVTLWRNKEKLNTTEDMGSLTALYTDEALAFMKDHKDKPFFLYLAHTMAHVKLGASEKFRGRSKGGLYGDVIEELDYHVGRVLDAVRELGLEKKTYVLFTSDNGPWLSKGKMGGSALPLRMGKGSAWEGGFRVPCIVWGPGRVPAGTHSNELTATLDLMPTFAALAGAEVPTDRVIDGRDQTALITGKTRQSARETFYYYVRSNLHAVRRGQWKLALPNRKRFYGYAPDTTEVVTLELYDLENDVSEKHDVADNHPDIVQELLKLADQVREDIGDLDHWAKNSRYESPK